MKFETQKLKNRIKEYLKMLHASCFMLHNPSDRGQKGVTLIELLAAMSIFTMVVTVTISIFISMVSTQKRSLNAVNIDNTAYFILEMISKEIRTGSDFSFPSCAWSGINSSCQEIAFVNYKNQNVRYKLNGSQIQKICDDAGNDCYVGSGTPAWNTISPSNVEISDLRFNMDGQNNNGPDNKAPRVSIVLKAQTLAGTLELAKREIILQTVISSREPDS